MRKALYDLVEELETVQKKLQETELCCAHLNDHQPSSALDVKNMCGKIEQAHQEWLAALDIVDDPIFMHDKECRIIRCNRAYQRYAGLAFDQIIGRPYYELFPKSAAPSTRRIDAENGACSLAHEGEEIDSSGRLFRLRAYSLQNNVGDYLYSVHVLEDITDYRQMERNLQDSEEKFRNITSSARDAIVMVDENALFSYWNKGAEKIFGYRIEEVSGRSMFDLIIPERLHAQAASAFTHYQKKKSGNPTDRTFEFVARKKNGDELPIEISISTIILKEKWNGVGIIRDITERKRSEQRLNLFRLLLDNANDAIHVIDPETFHIIDVNETACRDLGYTRDELLSLDFFSVDMETTAWHIKLLRRNLKQSGVVTFETTYRRKDGSLYPVEISLTEVTLDKRYAVAVIRNITERMQSEDSLRRANRAHQTLSAVNVALVRTNNETDLLKKVTRIIVDKGGYALAVVDFAQDDMEKNIVPVAWSGYRGRHYWAKELTWDDTEQGRTPAGIAIRTGLTQLCRDIRNPHITLSSVWMDASLSRGYFLISHFLSITKEKHSERSASMLRMLIYLMRKRSIFSKNLPMTWHMGL